MKATQCIPSQYALECTASLLLECTKLNVHILYSLNIEKYVRRREKVAFNSYALCCVVWCSGEQQKKPKQTS